ncbi:hypothetical protein Tco_0472528 [Tanacetum coccineum]
MDLRVAGSHSAKYDGKKSHHRNKEGQFKYQDNTRKQGCNEDTSSKEMLAIHGVGFDWSDMQEEQFRQQALWHFQTSCRIYNDNSCSKIVSKKLMKLLRNSVMI